MAQEGAHQAARLTGRGFGAAPRASTARVVGRYALFQIPGWLFAGTVALAAVELGDVAPWVAAAGFGLWVLKDVVMFPFVRRSYEPDGPSHGHVGDAGTALAAIRAGEEGWVRIGAELWRARCAPGARPIAAGEAVRVVGIAGLVLSVEPAGDT